MDYLLRVLGATAVVLNLSIPVAAKYCTYDVDGELRYYICPRNEYCCNFGCCLSPTFQFYQLWYYWLMVIFMFLLCSGGGWWYRYWLQGRYGPDLGSSMPPPSSRLHAHHLSHRPTRVSYHPSRDAVVLHHIWKPRGLGAAFPHASPPPSYACAQRAVSVSLSHDSSQIRPGISSIGAGGPKSSPYYQLYGPPPPYEAVTSSQGVVTTSTQSDDSDAQLHAQQAPSLAIDTTTVAAVSVSNPTASASSAATAVTISSPSKNDSSVIRDPHHETQASNSSNQDAV